MCVHVCVHACVTCFDNSPYQMIPSWKQNCLIILGRKLLLSVVRYWHNLVISGSLGHFYAVPVEPVMIAEK
uniref:Uncharacterized protein n=1 Tax=Octopus bimaculoides TaxID=37653 RepID=A0A0L8FZ43_OCTBM